MLLFSVACLLGSAPCVMTEDPLHGTKGSCGQVAAGMSCDITCDRYVRRCRSYDGSGHTCTLLIPVFFAAVGSCFLLLMCSGYEVSGGSRMCTSTGWSNSPTCIPSGCQGGNIPFNVDGGCKDAILTHGQWCNFNCADGYVLRNSGQIYGENTGAAVGEGATRGDEG
jgi:hypothetical protein